MMQLDAPARDAPADPAVLRLPPAALLVVAGVVHDTGTRGWRRRLLAGLARRCGRGTHLLLLDVTPAAALEGQRRRRRTLGRAAFAGHWRGWHRLRAALGSTASADGWASVRLLDRPAAARLRRVEIPAP